MKLAEWARKNSIHPRTAERWFHNGTLPVKAKQLSTGTILSLEEDSAVLPDLKVAIYGRVSTSHQKDDLKRQIKRLRNYCSSKGYKITKEVMEIASGMNDNRDKLNGILKDKSFNLIVVEHKDRLTRFGFNMLKNVLESQNRKIEVINESEFKEDLVQDFIDIITSMCSKIYGKRSAKNKQERMIKEIRDENL